jgi:hypothetical protein
MMSGRSLTTSGRANLLVLFSLVLASLLLALPFPAAAADEPPPEPVASVDALDVCSDLAQNAFAADECAQTGGEGDGLPSDQAPIKDDGLPAWCQEQVEVVFWTGSGWQELAEALAENPSPCADYYISVPPLAANKTRPRAPVIFSRIRALGPRFHPIAEVTLGSLTGWAKWVADGNGSWYEAGVEFRRRMVAAGLRPELGESWLINEFDRTTRLDTSERLPVEIARNVMHPYPRQAMRDLVRGLYEGAPGMPPLPGAAEIGINFSHQNLPDVPEYKEQMKGWLEDSAFWAEMQGRVRWLLREVYADTRFHSVPGTSRDERRRHLEAYQQHLLELVEAGPDTVETARSFLRETYLPLANAGYVALGGDAFDFVTAHGNTQVDAERMMHFVSEEVYAIGHYASSHPRGAPAGRLGFSWDPINRFGFPAPEFEQQIAALRERIALAIRYAYGQGAASAVGACSPPGSGEDWCQASRPGAQFTEVWEIFQSWD